MFLYKDRLLAEQQNLGSRSKVYEMSLLFQSPTAPLKITTNPRYNAANSSRNQCPLISNHLMDLSQPISHHPCCPIFDHFLHDSEIQLRKLKSIHKYYPKFCNCLCANGHGGVNFARGQRIESFIGCGDDGG